MGAKPKDITGQRFGKLVAVRLAKKRKSNGSAVWECRCDCGSETLVRADSLRGGLSKSCGCLRQERRGMKNGNELRERG